jgi:hypothetical protein
VLNANTPIELASLCPFVYATYPVEHPFMEDPGDRVAAGALAAVPRDWDWVVDEARRSMPRQLAAFPGMAAYYAASDAHLRARLGRGLAGASPPAYLPHQRLTLELPEASRASARRLLDGSSVRIAVLPAGAGEPWLYPSAASWELIVGALLRQLPKAAVCLVGKLTEDGRSTTSVGPGVVDRLRALSPAVLDCFDLQLTDELAVVEACDLFVSPHSGFGMAALSVGTPWLTLAGNRWPEYFYNGVPFYSVLPDPERFPCYTGLGADLPATASDSDGEGRRSLSMSADRVRADLDELLEAARMLIEGRLSYERALASHFERLLAFHRGDRSRIWSIDDLHRQYV